MELEKSFRNFDRKSQEYIIKRLLDHSSLTEDCDKDDYEKMYSYYYAMNVFNKFRLHLENINKEEKEELLKLVKEYIISIRRNGIDTYRGNLLSLQLCCDNDEYIVCLMNMAINYIDYKRKDYKNEHLNKEAFNKFINDWIEKDNMSEGFFISDFRDSHYWYIATFPDLEDIYNAAIQYDEFFRNNLDENSLNLYNKLNTKKVLYLIGKVASLSREDLALSKEKRIEREKLLKEKELKRNTRPYPKRKMPKIRQRKKQVTIIR